MRAEGSWFLRRVVRALAELSPEGWLNMGEGVVAQSESSGCLNSRTFSTALYILATSNAL